MTVSLKATMAALPKARRARIARRAAEIALEEMDLRGLRRSRARTQTALARNLGVGQEAVSRAEARGDLLLSTLRDYVAALGGELDLVVRFKDRAPVSLRGIGNRRNAKKAAYKGPPYAPLIKRPSRAKGSEPPPKPPRNAVPERR